MPKPQDTTTRERKNLNGLWAFQLDAQGTGRSAGWWRDRLPASREMPVPASYNDIVPDITVRDHVGDAWYQTVVRVPRSWTGERVVLRFDSATHAAVVWVNDVEVRYPGVPFGGWKQSGLGLELGLVDDILSHTRSKSINVGLSTRPL